MSQESGFQRASLLDALREELRGLDQQDFLWRVRTLQSPSAPHAKVDGKNVIVLCSNNYLGLANHPKLKQAAIAATRKYGAGSGSVRVIAGTMNLHVRLEKELADYRGTESSITFQSGYATNLGTIMSLVDERDLIISDELNHGSIIDGCRLTKAERRVYKHKDMGDLEKQLNGTERFRRILIITDGVFSMDGDIAPLKDIVQLAREHSAITYVDDAHGDGVLGKDGRGVTNHFHLEGKVDVDMGTFSKAFGCVGGYVVGSKDLCTYFQNKVRSYLLSGSQPPAVAGACIAALQIVQEQPSLLSKLWANTLYFKNGLKDIGFDTGNSETPITPVIAGDAGKARELAENLFKLGIFVLPIVYPMVAKDKARVRTIVTSAHTRKDLDLALVAFRKAGRQLALI
ncbi:MAG TPA: glycine C-acetyltransferase [Candidatus Bathyarchaeia archaeon]|nr:glycine C-acetyltransferase [Candidatus Bathyarchaeia archaeon]